MQTHHACKLYGLISTVCCLKTYWIFLINVLLARRSFILNSHTTLHDSNPVYHFPPDLYYGGDTFSVEQPQSFTCPYCGKMGYTETSLQEHVTSEHAETSTEVVSEKHTSPDQPPGKPAIYICLLILALNNFHNSWWPWRQQPCFLPSIL